VALKKSHDKYFFTYTHIALILTHYAYQRHPRRALPDDTGWCAVRHSAPAGALVVHDRTGTASEYNALLLLRRQDGRRTYFKANADSPLFRDLRGLLDKTSGIVPTLKSALTRFDERIELAFLYGSIARGEEHSASDVDLAIVGTLKQIDLLPALRKLEARFGREVNVTLFSPEEFRRKLTAEDHFLHSVLKGKTIPLKGTLNELEKTASRQ
jgi:predicted nucleotidyltransferase